MAVNHGHGKTAGAKSLIFAYDTGDTRNSYKGRPTENYIHHQNALPQSSYSNWSATSAGAWNTNHPDSIRAYNSNGGEISGYYNSGVTDAANTHHAHWQYDNILKKPVVVMNDVDGQWKAKSFGTGMGSWTSYGKGFGATYTISWLQWVDNLSKYMSAGLYRRTPENNNNFHDGRSTTYNTQVGTWQRVYHTFTTSTVVDLDSTYLSIYMYGHYGTRATIKVADVQFNWGDHPHQFVNGTRSVTEGLKDLTGNVSLNLSNVSFNSIAHPTWDGTDDYISMTGFTQPSDPNNFSVEAIVKLNSHNSGTNIGSVIVNNYSSLKGWIFYLDGPDSRLGLRHHNDGNAGGYSIEYGTGINLNQWYHIAATDDGTTVRLYINGLQVTSGSSATSVNYTGQPLIGQFGGGNAVTDGDIPVTKIYNRALTAGEVKTNYNNYKGRFNI